MNYIWDRISYTEKIICDAGCKLPLTSGIAHIIIDENGNELHCGEICAKKLAGDKPKGLPNITLSLENQTNHINGNSKNNSNANSFTDKKKLALEYLHLRYRFNKCNELYWSKVNKWYEIRNNLKSEDIY